LGGLRNNKLFTSFVFKGDLLSSGLGMKFSTKDQDNDQAPSVHCAQKEKGGWWYSDCGTGNLNVEYSRPGENTTSGMVWTNEKGDRYSLSLVSMMIKAY